MKARTTKGERESLCAYKLKESTKAVRLLKEKVAQLTTIGMVLDNALKNLKSAKENVSKQLHVIDQQIELGEVSRGSLGQT